MQKTIKMSEMDQSVRSVAERFCLYIVHKVASEKLCTDYCVTNRLKLELIVIGMQKKAHF